MSELIKFIKSIFKWIILFIIIIALIIGAVVTYNYNNDRLVTMFAMTCEYYENNKEEFNSRLFSPRYYLIKKRNKSELPHSIYRGIHLLNDIKNSKEKIYEQSRLKNVTPDEYLFETIQGDSTFKLNRKNLSLEFKTYSTNGLYEAKALCELISEKDFYSAIEKIMNKKFEGNKI